MAKSLEEHKIWILCHPIVFSKYVAWFLHTGSFCFITLDGHNACGSLWNHLSFFKLPFFSLPSLISHEPGSLFLRWAKDERNTMKGFKQRIRASVVEYKLCPLWSCVSACVCEEDIMMTKKGNKKFSEGLLKNIKIYFNEIKKKWVSGWMDGWESTRTCNFGEASVEFPDMDSFDFMMMTSFRNTLCITYESDVI